MRTPLAYNPIPCVAEAYMIFEDGKRETWDAIVSGAGQLECLIDAENNRFTSMEALHARGISAYTLEFQHTVGVRTQTTSNGGTHA